MSVRTKDQQKANTHQDPHLQEQVPDVATC